MAVGGPAVLKLSEIPDAVLEVLLLPLRIVRAIAARTRITAMRPAPMRRRGRRRGLSSAVK
jgi:hypothetical protein